MKPLLLIMHMSKVHTLREWLFSFKRSVVTVLLLYNFLQSQRSPAPVSARSAQRQHLRPGPEGRHHHEAVAGAARQEPAGGTGHRRQRDPTRTTIISPERGLCEQTQTVNTDFSQMWCSDRMQMRGLCFCF